MPLRSNEKNVSWLSAVKWTTFKCLFKAFVNALSSSKKLFYLCKSGPFWNICNKLLESLLHSTCLHRSYSDISEMQSDIRTLKCCQTIKALFTALPWICRILSHSCCIWQKNCRKMREIGFIFLSLGSAFSCFYLWSDCFFIYITFWFYSKHPADLSVPVQAVYKLKQAWPNTYRQFAAWHYEFQCVPDMFEPIWESPGTSPPSHTNHSACNADC